MTSMPLVEEREHIVRAHMAAESKGDFDAARATFHHPRYEIVATGEVYDGDAAVTRFYQESATAFPDMRFDPPEIRHAADAVFVETTFRGTHLGSFRGLPATARLVAYAMLNVFLFEENRLVGERMYFDLMTPLRQVGIARDPTTTTGRIAVALNHPITVGSALIRSVLGRSRGASPGK